VPPTLIFVDTSAWYALLDRKDRNHSHAVRFAQESGDLLLTSTYILDETVTLMRAHLGHAIAVRFGDRLWKEEITRLVRIAPEDEMRAWTIFARCTDKDFSYTDCTSFALMERLQIEAAFAFDIHFAQYGRFACLPTP